MGDERTWWTSLTFKREDMGMNEEKRHYVLEIRERMEARGLYDESLEPAIGVLAGLLCRLDTIRESIAEEGTMLTVVSREGNPRTILNPAVSAEIQCTEEIRKYFRDLGLSVAKPAGFVNQEKDARPRSGDRLVSLMEGLGGQKPTLYKRKDKN